MVEIRQSSRTFRETSSLSERVMLTVRWSVNCYPLKPGETIKTVKHFAGTQQMHDILTEPQPALLNRHGVLLVHDDARPHSSKMILKKIKYLLRQILIPYSPDIALTDFHVFKHLQHFSWKKINSIVRWMLKLHSVNFLSTEIQIPLKKG